jgi:biotin operon repressor
VEPKLVQTSLPDRVLRLLAEGGIHSTAELARRLGVTEALITALAENLTRRGYLMPVDTGCGQRSCSGCWAAGSCEPPRSIPMLALTPKGRQAATRPQSQPSLP